MLASNYSVKFLKSLYQLEITSASFKYLARAKFVIGTQ